MRKLFLTAFAIAAISMTSAQAVEDTSETYREFFYRYDTEPVSKKVYEMFVIGVEQGLRMTMLLFGADCLSRLMRVVPLNKNFTSKQYLYDIIITIY